MSDPVIRNLTDPQPLDVDAETHRLMFTVGILQSAIEAMAPGVNKMSKEETRAVLWRRIPFIKALGELARNHSDETRALWKEALQEPMPFGCAPLGLPEGEEP